jgi:glycosyltransferase involved in cell wall biosynthesis
MPDAPLAKPRLRIGFVHRFDARNIRSWSGTFYFMSQALEAHVGEVIYLGPDLSRGTKFIIDNVARVNRIWQRLTGTTLATDHNWILSKRLGRFFESRLKESPCDVLFAPVASVEIASLRTSLPIVYFTDITWAEIVDYYPEFSLVSTFGRSEGERIEAASIRRANAAVFPSDWAAASACQHYGSDPGKTFKVSFGANLNDPPSRSMALHRTVQDRVNLLMVGVDWERKGGAIAFECMISLLEHGVNAHLTILGCVPPAGFDHPNLQVVPFLDKNDPKQRQQIAQLFLASHFMLVPTRADATPIVTCEASAFGLPILAADTGGLRGSIREGYNGFLLPHNASGTAYADKIRSILADPGRYNALVPSTRDEFEQTLNWDSWGNSMRGVFETVLNRKIPVNESTNRTTASPGRNEDPLEMSETLAAEVSST